MVPISVTHFAYSVPSTLCRLVLFYFFIALDDRRGKRISLAHYFILVVRRNSYRDNMRHEMEIIRIRREGERNVCTIKQSDAFAVPNPAPKCTN